MIFTTADAKLIGKCIEEFVEINKRNTLILLSIDFSHSLSREETEKADKKSLTAILSLNSNYPLSLTRDSCIAYYTAMQVLKNSLACVQILYHTNSEIYFGHEVDDITSYIFRIFYNTK